MRWLPPLVAAALVSASATASSPPSLHFAWADGSAVAMRGKTYVWCGKWDDGANVRTLRIQQGSPFTPPWWMVEIRLSLARRGRTIRFPALVGKTATMFVTYPRKQLEASAESERSRGALTILDDVDCRPGSQIRFTVRATLASEEAGGPSISIRGALNGTLGTRPGPGVNP